MFIRFVVYCAEARSHRLPGIFFGSNFAQQSGRLDRYQSERLEEAYHWFAAHLPEPPFDAQCWPEASVCWFRNRAHEQIRRAWEIVTTPEEEGVRVYLLRSDNPGRMLYADEYQIVVLEWRSFRRDWMRRLRGTRLLTPDAFHQFAVPTEPRP